MHKYSIAAGALALALLPVAAGAQSPGPYAGVAGGVNFLSDSDFDIAGPVEVENEYDTGYVVAGFVGYDFGQVWQLGGVRVDGEISYRENDIDVHSVAALGGDQPGSTGEASALAFMANVYHDFLPNSPLRPYLGGGIGLAMVDFSDYGIAAVPNVMDDDDTAFAWQLAAGISYDFTPNIALTADYRYFNAEPELTTSAGTGSVANDVDYQNHTLLFGIRYTF